jgi:hypothetical protein
MVDEQEVSMRTILAILFSICLTILYSCQTTGVISNPDGQTTDGQQDGNDDLGDQDGGTLIEEEPGYNIVRQENIHNEIGLFYDVYNENYNVIPEGCHFQAGDLEGIDLSYVVSDTATAVQKAYPFPSIEVTEDAIRMTADGVRIPISFRGISPGVYFIRLVGRVDNDNISQIRKPLYVHLSIDDGPNHEVSNYRMRVLYDNKLEEVGRIFFWAVNTTNSLNAEIYLGPGSQEELLLHRIEFYDALAGTARQGYKTQPGTFTFGERDTLRAWAEDIATRGAYEQDENGDIYGDYIEWRWINNPYPHKDLSTAERAARDELIWNAMPPLNAMHIGSSGGAGSLGPYLTPDGNHNGWKLDYNDQPYYRYPWDVPWRMINETLGAEYTLDDYIAHRSLPDPTYPDDGFGFYDGSTYFIITAISIFERIFPQYYGAIYAREGGLNLSRRYHVTGDEDVAWDASLALVRFAMQWPALHMEAQDLTLNSADPELVFNGHWRWEGRRIGKFYYSGWSGGDAEGLAMGYDYLFDFIDGNQAFADAVNRFIPWVTSPADVIKLLDTHVLQSSIADTKTGRIRQLNPIKIALIQNPCPYADQLADISQALIDVYPLRDDTIKNHYHNSYSQDGTDFIGSTHYVLNTRLIEAAGDLARYKAMGGTVPFDLTDIDLFPKIRSFSNFVYDFIIAGGFHPSLGDVAGAPYQAPRLNGGVYDMARPIWQLTQNPKAAWFLVNETGREGESDAEWAEITAAAASIPNPKVHTGSRVLNGFGIAALDMGSDSSNRLDKGAVTIRAGTGVGHAHSDALDIGLFAMGLRMGTDFGQRSEGSNFTLPPAHTSYVHNTVEVDGYLHPWKVKTDSFGDTVPPGSFTQANGWVRAFKPLYGAQFLAAEAASMSHPNLNLFVRDLATINISGSPAEDSHAFYVADFFRVSGGKWHTWCFHGADSGVEQDGFVVNVALSPVSDDSSAGLSASYLRKHANGRKFEGLATDKIEAIWRLSRTSSTTSETNVDRVNGGEEPLTVTTYAAEPNILGSDYDEGSARKYTKITLLGHSGDTVLVGNLFSQQYRMNIPNLYVQTRQTMAAYSQMQDLDSIYPVIIEAYPGSSYISSIDLLPISPTESNAYTAKAIRVQTTTGQDDIIISDLANIQRSVNGGQMQFQGRFGYYSEDANGFRMLHLVGGVELTKENVSVQPTVSEYQTSILDVDYDNLQIFTTERLPANVLDGEQIHIYNADHRATYQALTVRDSGAGSLLTMQNPADMGEFHVEGVEGNDIISDDTLVMAYVVGRHKGLTAVNELGTKKWKLEKTSGLDCSDDCHYTLTGDSVSQDDFTDENGDYRSAVTVYDYGPSDNIHLFSHVFIKREASNQYSVSANTGMILTLPGGGTMEVSQDGATWQDVSTGSDGLSVTGSLDVSLFSSGPILVRVLP